MGTRPKQLGRGTSGATTKKECSPRATGATQFAKPTEADLLKALARKKRKLNEELWDAASNGDVAAISRLLDQYRSRAILIK